MTFVDTVLLIFSIAAIAFAVAMYFCDRLVNLSSSDDSEDILLRPTTIAIEDGPTNGDIAEWCDMARDHEAKYGVRPIILGVPMYSTGRYTVFLSPVDLVRGRVIVYGKSTSVKDLTLVS